MEGRRIDAYLTASIGDSHAPC